MFSSVGPAGHRTQDTWVLAWRFSTTSSGTTGGARPRQSSDFATLCPSLAEPVAGKDRVALVLDYGTASDAPPGQRPPSTTTARVECLTLPSHPTGLAVLNAADVTIRSQDGLMCALDGYPKGECAPIVADPTSTPKPSPTRTRTPSPTASATPAPTTPSTSTGSTSGATTAATPSATGSAVPGGASASSGSAAALPSTDSSPSTSDDPSGDAEPTLSAAAGAPAASGDGGSSGPVGAVVAAVVVVALGGSAWWTSRRRA